MSLTQEDLRRIWGNAIVDKFHLSVAEPQALHNGKTYEPKGYTKQVTAQRTRRQRERIQDPDVKKADRGDDHTEVARLTGSYQHD